MKSVKHYLFLIAQKSAADLVSEARRGYIGIFWWIIEPIIYMSVFYLLFVVVLKREGEDHVAFLLTGLVVWKWFAVSVPLCAHCISANAGLIRQVYIPKLVFPGMVIMTSSIKFLMVFALFIIFLLLTGKTLNVTWLALPILMLIQLLMMFAIGSLLAAIVPFIPDLKIIIDNGMILLFFLSGVFFDISLTTPEIMAYLYLNPMVGIIEGYRCVLLDGIWPHWLILFQILFFSITGIAFGAGLLHKFDRMYAKVI